MYVHLFWTDYNFISDFFLIYLRVYSGKFTTLYSYISDFIRVNFWLFPRSLKKKERKKKSKLNVPLKRRHTFASIFGAWMPSWPSWTKSLTLAVYKWASIALKRFDTMWTDPLTKHVLVSDWQNLWEMTEHHFHSKAPHYAGVSMEWPELCCYMTINAR